MEWGRRLGEPDGGSCRDDGRERSLQHRLHDGSRPHLGSGRKRGILKRALGRSRGGFTCKIHCIADQKGRPLAFHITPGEAADCKAFDELIDLPDTSPGALLADRAYDSDLIRSGLADRDIEAVIPSKTNRTLIIPHDERKYKDRNCIERVFGHLKINRALATRYDQLAETFLGTLQLAAARYWIKFVHAA